MSESKSSTKASTLTPIGEALPALLKTLPLINETESIPLLNSNGRVIAEDYQAGFDVPPHDNSAMDGYAVLASDLEEGDTTLQVVQRIAAGEIGDTLKSGQAARIFTGAVLPVGADAVVMQENCSRQGDIVKVHKSVSPGENLRRAGEDIAVATRVFSSGHRLRPQDIGVLASLGETSIVVKRRLRIALLTTGDELVRPGNELKPGQIYNSNFYSLHSLLKMLDVEIVDMGIVVDDLASTKAALQKAAESSDCVISTGGVSVGEEDHVRAAVESLGSIELWKLAIKPGKPLACGKISGTQFFGLPGNPVSTFVTYGIIVKPCLLSMLGCTDPSFQSFSVSADFAKGKTRERQEYSRVCVRRDDNGTLQARPISNQSSGVGSSLAHADGLAVIPPYTSIEIGDTLEYIPFSELLY